MEKKDIVLNGYLGYKFEDLETEQQVQTDKANTQTLSPAARIDAMERMEVIEFATSIYMAAVEEGHDVTGMRFDEAITLVTGVDPTVNQGVGLWKKTNEGIDKAVDVSVQILRTGTNKFGQWLTKISTKQ